MIEPKFGEIWEDENDGEIVMVIGPMDPADIGYRVATIVPPAPASARSLAYPPLTITDRDFRNRAGSNQRWRKVE